MEEYKYSIDAWKFLCAALVVAIHCNPLTSINETANFYLVDVLARIAVPFFFAASGYLLFGSMEFKSGKLLNTKRNREIAKKYLMHIIRIYTVWSAIYLLWQIPYWYSIGWTGIHAIKDYIVSFFLQGSYYHFWYFLCLIYGIAILYLLLIFVGINVVEIICSVCYVIKCLTYAYYWIPIPGLDAMTGYFENYSGILNAVCLAMPFLLVGVVNGQRKCKQYSGRGVLSFFILLVIEATVLKFYSPNGSAFSYIFFTLPLCYFLFKKVCGTNYIPRLHKDQYILVRKSSEIIYCIHPLLTNLLLTVAFYNNVNSVIQYLIVLFASAAIAYILLKFASRIHFIKLLM